MNAPIKNVAGLILAAGQSRRMGRPKMTLAWGETTIIAHVAGVLLQGGAHPLVAVTGGMRSEVEGALRELPVTMVFNPQHESGGMLSSVHSGLQALGQDVPALLIALGDQPQIQVQVVQALIREYQSTQAPLIVPSYQMRRGHPWLVARELWPEILALQHPQTLRDFLERKSAEIHYLPVGSDSILQDIDTPEQYEQYRPE
jgi:molybdenum cofactor cytidylyltransferase